MNKVGKTIKTLLDYYDQLDKLKDKITELFDNKLSSKCEYYVPPNDPDSEEDFDDIHICNHRAAAGVCCINECPLLGYEEMDITCPLILIDEHGPERVCGVKLLRTKDGGIICPDCEEEFKLTAEPKRRIDK